MAHTKQTRRTRHHPDVHATRPAPRSPQHRRPAGRRRGLRGHAALPQLHLRRPHRLPPAGRGPAARPSPHRAAHTTVALFDPEDYAEFCAESRPRPGRRRPAAPASPPRSPPPAPPSLRRPAPRRPRPAPRRTRPSAAPPGSTPPCCSPASAPARTAARTSAGPPSTAPRTSSSRLLDTPQARAPTTSSAARPRRPNSSSPCSTPRGTRTDRADLDAAEGAEFATVLAVGVATRDPGRPRPAHHGPGHPDRVHGWRLHGGSPRTPHGGRGLRRLLHRRRHRRPVSPESGVEYCAGFDLGADEPEAHH